MKRWSESIRTYVPKMNNVTEVIASERETTTFEQSYEVRGSFSFEFSSTSDDEREDKHKNSGDFLLNVKVSLIPHPSKVEKGGEDAFFVSEDGKSIGIADGVGGWTLHGVDPAIFAQTLMREAKSCYQDRGFRDPAEILRQAYHRTQHVPGSSTACIMVVDGNQLNSVNIGDSGFMVIRDRKIAFRSKEQSHSFNYPFQLGTASENSPEDAASIQLEIQEGDIVIMGSDGLFDNLFDGEILDIVNTQMTSREESRDQNISQILAKTAFNRSQSEAFETPFRKLAYDLGLVDSPFGGKLDDITVLVAKVVSNKPREQPV